MSESNILDRFKEYVSQIQFDAVRIGIASPKKMLSLSYGEVKKIETINYRTLKPEKDGLFCAKIFGPQKDWECNCGKYKRMKHRGITCEKCGVEVIQSRVRRERMGHVSLVAPVCHIWFLKGTPSYLSIILDVMVKDLEKVTYFDGYIILNQGTSPYPAKTVLSIPEYEEYVAESPEDADFAAGTGAEAIGKILEKIDLSFESRFLAEEIERTTTVSLKHKLSRKYKILKGMLDAGIRPEWMVISTMPVIPPDLRPLVSLPGGRFASSDLNDLYRRVLNRNIRLKRLILLCAPEIIIKNEKRMLQESVDALIDNGRRGQFVRGSNKRPLKSLSEMLRGKQGRFRQNLLGKRVDYSARSVIVVEPKLKLNQCGLPKIMALELFKPYVYAELQQREVAPNLRVAKKMVNQMLPETWSALEAVVAGRPVLLNRAPTLHRLGFQAFFPVLVEGKSIKLHPLVCGAYNADFDGDMMAVHVPLSQRARKEALALMFAEKNLISPSHGRPLMGPTQDMVLGLYFLTKQKKNVSGEGCIFSSVEEVIFAYDHEKADTQAGIKLHLKDEIIETTVGRVILYNALPKGSDINWINQAMRHRNLETMIYKTWCRFGNEETAKALDEIKLLGFEHATIHGISLGIDNVVIPDIKTKIIESSHKSVKKIESLYRSGAITNGERYNKVIQVWAKAEETVTQAMLDTLETQDMEICANKDFKSGEQKDFNPIYMMLDSGARSSKQQIRQLGGMRGLMASPTEEIIEKPVISNLKEGLGTFEYFISTHGTRKGLADTALKTADAGYLTRRLVDVSQDVVITKEDCEGIGYITIKDLEVGGEILVPAERRVFGRIMAEDVVDPITGSLLLKEGEIVKDEDVPTLKDSSVIEYKVRSPLTCSSKRGICAKCYGVDLSKNKLVDVGLAVGIIAAQSIGEPGTQLTLRTFHIGGTASGLVEENFVSSKHTGSVRFESIKLVFNEERKQHLVVNRRGKIIITREDGREVEQIDAEYGSAMLIKDGGKVKIGAKLMETTPYTVILSDSGGHVEFVDLIANISLIENFDDDTNTSEKVVADDKNSQLQPCIVIKDNNDNEASKYYIPSGAHVLVSNKEKILPGQILATIPREKQRAKDITGGLPRVVELFEARNPKDPAILSEINGTVEFCGLYKGNRRINVISNTGEVSEYIVPKNKHLNVVDGDKITAGCMIADGTPSAHDILKIMGPRALQEHLVKGVQEVYGTQGVKIHDKHVEIIIRQMLRKVKITDPGGTNFVVGETVDRTNLKLINDAMVEADKKVAIGNPILMGITKASLETDSFIAAAAFQETTRVLAEASITGQVDHLRCLKSNVALGRLISAGTGVASFKEKYIGKDISELEEQANKEEELEAGLDNISLI